MSVSKDLIVLVADKDIECAIRGLLKRQCEIGIRNISFDSVVHPQHDPGCYKRSSDLIRGYLKTHSHALVIFDREGSGKETSTASEIEIEVERSLSINGWTERAAVVVLDPELESWVWSKSSAVATTLGWPNSKHLYQCLLENNFIENGHVKPLRPKEALNHVRKLKRIPKSPSLFSQLAAQVDFKSCEDRSLNRLLTIMRTWFPLEV